MDRFIINVLKVSNNKTILNLIRCELLKVISDI